MELVRWCLYEGISFTCVCFMTQNREELRY